MPGLEAFLDQWTAFPNGAHDDMVDSASQALSWLLNAPGGEAALPEADEAAEILASPDLYEVYD